MKTKKILSLLITMMMCLSMVAFPVSATEATQPALSSYNVTTSGIYLTFSETVTAYSVSVEDYSGKRYGEATATENATASVEIKLNEKLSLDGEYLLKLSATGTSGGSLNSTKLITFNTLFADDFESYTTANELDNNYRVITSEGFGTALPSSYTSDEQLSLEKANGNTRLKVGFKSICGLWIQKYTQWDQSNKYYTFEGDFEIIPTTNNYGIQLGTQYTSIRENYLNIGISPVEGIEFHETVMTGLSKVKPTSELNAGTKFTLGFTSAKVDASTESFAIYLNGAEKTSATGTLRIPSGGTFTILGCTFGSQYYLDNWKMYTASLSDYVEFNMDSYNITTSGVYFNFNKNVTSYQLSVKDGLGNVLGETSVSNNATAKAALTLNTKMSLSDSYLLTYRFENENTKEVIAAEKLITFNTLFYDDFESYTTANDLDNNYYVITSDAWYPRDNPSNYTSDGQLSIAEADGNKRLKVAFASKPGLWIKKFDYNQSNMYYTFEGDFEIIPTTSNYGIQLGTQYTSLNDNFKNIEISPVEGIKINKTVIAGLSNVPSTSELNAGTKFTLGFTSAKVDDSTESFAIYLNGAEKTSATGTLKHDVNGIFTILGCALGSQYYLDNWKMYTASLSDYVDNEFSLTYSNYTARGIHLGLSAEANTSVLPTVVLKEESGAEVPTYIEWEDDNKSLSIIPVKNANSNNSYDNLNPLKMGTTYLIEVSNIKEKAGFKLIHLERGFKFKEIWSDDFEGYILADGTVDYDKLIANYDFVGYFNNGEGDNSIKEPPKENITPYYGIKDGWLTFKPGTKAYISKDPFNTNFVLDVDAKRIESSSNGDYDRGLFFKFNANYSAIEEKEVHLMHRGWQPGTTEVWNNLSRTLDKSVKTEFANKLQDTPYGMTIVKNTAANTGNGTIGLYENGEKMVYKEDVTGAYIYAITSLYHKNAIDNWRLYTASDFEINYEITGATVDGTKLTANILIKNYLKKDITDGEIIIAAYNNSGKLIGITREIWDGTDCEKSCDITLAGNETPKSIKAFLWEDLASMTPICASAGYNMN